MNFIRNILGGTKADGPRVPVDTTPSTDVDALEAQVQEFDRQIAVLREQKRSAAEALSKAIVARNARNMAEALRQAGQVSVKGQVVDVSAGV